MAQLTIFTRFAWVITTLLSVTTTGSAAMPGETVYRDTCIACHGADGEGTLPGVPDLVGPNGALGKADAVLMNNIINGIQSPGSPLSMPPKGGNPELSREDVEAVIRYMRETFGSK